MTKAAVEEQTPATVTSNAPANVEIDNSVGYLFRCDPSALSTRCSFESHTV